MCHRIPCHSSAPRCGGVGQPSRHRSEPPPAAERGQAVPLVLVAVVLAASLAVGVVRVAGAVRARADAQAAADAAALAGAGAGEAAARAAARANRAMVVRYAERGDEVEVTVRRDGVERTARAGWRPDDTPSEGAWAMWPLRTTGPRAAYGRLLSIP